MKKSSVIFLVFIILSLFLLLAGNIKDQQNPFKSVVDLDYPQFSIIDDNGFVYVIDTSRRRILVSDSTGNLLTKIVGGDRREGRIYYADSIVTGGDDSFFVLNYVLDEYGTFLLREELMEYDISGEFKRIFYQKTYTERRATLVQRGEIFSPRIQQNYMYFFLVDAERIRLIRKSLLNQTTELIGDLPFSDADAFIADIEWLDDRNYLILDKRGYITWGDLNGNTKNLFYKALIPGNQNDRANPLLPDEYFTDMTVSDTGDLYITDLIGRQIVYISDSMLRETLQSSNSDLLYYTSTLSRETLKRGGLSDEPFIYYTISYGPSGFVTNYDYGLYYANEKEILQHYKSFNPPLIWIIRSYLWWSGLFIAGLTLLVFIVYVYIRVLKRRLSIMIKQTIVILPLMIGGIVLISTLLLQGFIAAYEGSNIDKMLSLAQTMGANIDGDLLYNITSLSDYMNTEYRTIREKLHKSLNYNLDNWNRGLYFALYQVIDETLYGFMYLNNEIGLRHPFNWYEDPQSVYRTAYNGTVVFEQTTDVSGNFLYAIAPIYDSQNQPVALLEIGSDLYSFQQNARALYNNALIYMSLVSIAVIIFVLIMTSLLLKNIGVLSRGVERIAEGDWNYQIDLQSNDEISELGERFNHMSNSINTHLNHIEVLNTSYQKFFPDDFLKHLNLHNVTEVKLGDQIRKDMTILFSDIRSFTSISEKLDPEENFNFLNEYLTTIGPVIRQNSGFIDKYIGDAIMALFPNEVKNAVDASLDMLTRLKDINISFEKKNFPKIEIGIGIHTGSLMLGILGEQQRMEGTVIADSVNFASRLESLTKQVGATIIISEDSIMQLDPMNNYLKQYIGQVQVSGKKKSVKIYEILNALPKNILEVKLQSKAALSQAIGCFEKGDLKAAFSYFQKLQLNPITQKIASLYIQCLEEYKALYDVTVKKGEQPPVWDGIMHSRYK